MSGLAGPGFLTLVVAMASLAEPPAAGLEVVRANGEAMAPVHRGDTLPPVPAGEERPEPPRDLGEIRSILEGERPAEAVPLLLAGAMERAPERGTRWLELAKLLGELEEESARAVGRAALEEEAGRPGRALERVEDALDGAAEVDRPRLLAMAARLAEIQEAGGGEAFRLRLVRNHPEAAEAPESIVWLARRWAAGGGDEERAEARSLLEELIVSRPNHPLVPGARRVLERLDTEQNR